MWHLCIWCSAAAAQHRSFMQTRAGSRLLRLPDQCCTPAAEPARRASRHWGRQQPHPEPSAWLCQWQQQSSAARPQSRHQCGIGPHPPPARRPCSPSCNSRLSSRVGSLNTVLSGLVHNSWALQHGCQLGSQQLSSQRGHIHLCTLTADRQCKAYVLQQNSQLKTQPQPCPCSTTGSIRHGHHHSGQHTASFSFRAGCLQCSRHHISCSKAFSLGAA